MKIVDGYRKFAEYLVKQRNLEDVFKITDQRVMELMQSNVVNEGVFYIDGSPENCLWRFVNGKFTVMVLSTGQIYDHDDIEFGVQLENGEEIALE